MTQLLSKDFLHEPLSEIAAKYPAWLAEHGATLYVPGPSRRLSAQRLGSALRG